MSIHKLPETDSEQEQNIWSSYPLVKSYNIGERWKQTGTSKTGPYNNRNADQCLHGGQHIHCAITIADLCSCVTFNISVLWSNPWDLRAECTFNLSKETKKATFEY